MPWTDPYDVVLEDTLAVNVNPDDQMRSATTTTRQVNQQRRDQRHRHHRAQAGLDGRHHHAASDAFGGSILTWNVKNRGHGPQWLVD